MKVYIYKHTENQDYKHTETKRLIYCNRTVTIPNTRSINEFNITKQSDLYNTRTLTTTPSSLAFIVLNKWYLMST